MKMLKMALLVLSLTFSTAIAQDYIASTPTITLNSGGYSKDAQSDMDRYAEAESSSTFKKSKGQKYAEASNFYYIAYAYGIQPIEDYFNDIEYPEGFQMVMKHFNDIGFENIGEISKNFKIDDRILKNRIKTSSL